MLVALLAVVVSPRPRAAMAQSDPYVQISIGDQTLVQGQLTYLYAAFHNMPQNPNDDTKFGNISFRYLFERNSDGSWVNADSCTEDLVGGDLFITTWWRPQWNHGPNDFALTTTCPVGSYRLRVSVKDRDLNTELVSGTHDISVSLGPSVTIEMPSGPYYRGASFNPAIKFNNLVQGADYTYEADLRTRNPTNYARICEGTGLETGKTFALNGITGNPVQKTVTVTDNCPTNEYKIEVELYDSDNRKRGAESVDFEITTDPDAIPSVSVSMSESSPVAPGTEFDITFSFYDIQPGASIRYHETMIDTTTNQAVSSMFCGGGFVGWGQEVLATFSSNPYVNRVSIPSDCPAGNYRIVSEIGDPSGNDIISGSIDFTIGYPNLTPTAPSVPGYNAKQNTPFSQQLPEGTGGDAPLSYAATPLPAGLNFNNSTRTIAGTPAGTGSTTVRYTVTDSDGDSAYVDFDITVAPDLTPTAPSITGFTAKQNTPFSQQLPEGTGGDAPLSYAATPLPAGLSFITTTRTIAGTPTGTGSTTVRYTVTDSDGDSAYVEFDITVNADLTPTAPSITGYTAKQDTPFSQQLPEGTGGDAPLSYEATPLPAGLSFITTTRTIAGTPTGTGSTTVRYTVTDSDGDSAYVEFDITVNADLTPTAPGIPGYTAKQNTPFSQQLPEGGGGDAPLSYQATPLPAGLSFITTTRTITGTPTGTGSTTVRYTVTDSDGDSAYVDFDITVNAELTPAAPSISGYTAKQNSPFSQQLPEGTGGDAPLSYAATPLPAGLSFITTTRTIEGTPTGTGSTTVRYTVTDSDADSAYVEFTITVAPDLTPTIPSISGYTIKVGVQFSQQLPEGTGGDAPLSYAATPLPAGLSFITTTRTITGTPSVIQEVDVTYSVEDADGDKASQEFKISVTEQDTEPTLPNEIPDFTLKAGILFTQQLPAANGGATPYRYSVSVLPPGLTFVQDTRTITGTPSSVGFKDVTYTVTDANDQSVSDEFRITVNANQFPNVESIADTTAKLTRVFSLQLPMASGGDGSLDYSATGLPPGLSFITSTRTITGTPTTEGQYTVAYRATDEDNDPAQRTFAIDVYALPALEAIKNVSEIKDEVFTLPLSAVSGGRGPFVYDATPLPTGLTFVTSTLTITGTPTEIEEIDVTYSVEDADGDTASQEFKISVTERDTEPKFTYEIPNFVLRVGSPFAVTLPSAIDGNAPYNYTISGHPDTLTFNTNTRRLTGTPSASHTGTHLVTYTATDRDLDEVSQTFQLNVAADKVPSLENVAAQAAKLTRVFSLQLPLASGGDGSLDYSATGLPPGLSFITSTRTITGTPTAAGPYTVTYSATDEDNDPAQRTFAIDVYALPALAAIQNVTATEDEVFTLVLTAVSGGRGPFEFEATPLPTGLTFVTSTLTITGTPTVIQDIDVTYSVEDADGDTARQEFQISVSEEDTTPTFPYDIPDLSLRVGSPFLALLPAATGGNLPYTYTISGLPDSLTFITDTRTITGTPTAAQVHEVTYSATDQDLDVVSQTFEINVAADKTPAQPSVSDMHLKVTRSLLAELPAGENGDPPYTYTITTLPSGLHFNRNTRFIAGTPDTAGSIIVTYTITDEDKDSASVDFTLTVYDLPDLADISDTSGMKGELFTLELAEATGGRPPLEYSVTGLPSGLEFITTTRVITGTPTQVEVGNVTYKVVDQDDDQDTVTFTITVTDLSENLGGNYNNNNNNSNIGNNNGGTITAPALTLTDTSGFALKVGQQFTQQLPAANGGTPPYQYAVTALPPGLTFNRGSHTLSGTPTTPGATNITYWVTDANSNRASDDFTITVNAAPLSLGDTIGFSATVGEPFTQQLPAATGGSSPYAYGVTTLPAGLTFEHATRTITGTPSVAETRVVTYSVSDGNRTSAHDAFTITVNEALTPQPEGTEGNTGNTQGSLQLTLVGAKEFNARVGVLYTQQLPAATGGSSPYAYGVNVLPAGLRFEHATRTITGTPTTAETKVVTYSVTDGAQARASDTFTITVGEAQGGPPGQPGGGGNQGGRGPGGTPGGSNQGGNNQGGNNQGGNNQGGGNQGGGGGGGNQGGKKNSGSSGNQQKYVPPSSYSPPSQQHWSPSHTPVAVTLPQWLNVRRGPGIDYEIITSVPEGTRGNIYGRDAADNWFQVQINEVSDLSWVCQDLTRVEGSLDNVRLLAQWEIDLIPKSSDGPLATTTPAILNVRAGPGLDYEILTTVPKGTEAAIIGIGPNAQWYMVTLEALNRPAWIYAGLTTLTGFLGGVKQYTLAEVNGYTYTEADGTDTCGANPVAITIPAIMNVRNGPGLSYDIVTTVVKGTRADIIGIGPLDEWFLVRLDKLDEPAWLYRGLTTVVGSLAGVRRIDSWQDGQPNVVTDAERPNAVTYPSLVNIRVGPGLTYPVLKTVRQGTRASIIGLSPDANWYLVEIDGMSQLGWIREDLTVLVGNLNNVKRITAAELAMLPVAIVDTPKLNVRTGPGLGYRLVTTIPEGTWVQIIGVNARADWYQVKMRGVTGQTWVYRDLTNLAGLLAGVTQISSSTVAAEYDPTLHATTILEAASTVESSSPQQIAVNAITVDLSLPADGNINLEVSWTDAEFCSEAHNLYYRSGIASTTYFSLENAVIATASNSKSLSFLTLPDRSLISAWCGTHSNGRQIAEVRIDASEEGIYSSLPSQPETGTVAAVP